MIIQDALGNVNYIDDDEVSNRDELGMFGAVEPHAFDFVGYENLFHSLPKDQLEVMVCLYLGMKPLEIVKTLRFKNVARFYNISSRLRKSYQERKGAFMD